MTVQAIYTGGVFKPLQPLSLPEGSQVEVIYSIARSTKAPSQTVKSETEYERRIRAVRSIDELLSVQSTAPALPAGYDLCEALDANRHATGERQLYRDLASGAST